MNCTRTCDQQRQPCPSPWHCITGCNFTEATTDDLGNAHDMAATTFWHSDPPFIAFSTRKQWVQDQIYALVDLCKWVLPVGFVLGLGYGAWRLLA